MSEEQQHSHCQIIRGLPCPIASWFTKKKMEDAMDFVPGDGDLILASYPKTGTTWMQYILLQIKSKGELFPSLDDVTFRVVPYIEMAGVEAVHAQDKPRFYKHHFPYNYVQKNDKSKCIYIYRNPEDTVVSFYHFSRNLLPEFSPDFNVYFDRYVTGNISYGNYFQHVLSFYEHRDDDNLLMVSYEKLHANRRDEILRIAKFLGDGYHQNLLEDDEMLDKIIEHTNFDYMKKNLYLTHPDKKSELQEAQSEETTKVNFFRKGIIGDGRAVLTDEQRQRLKDAAEKVLKGTRFMEEWYPE